MRISGTPGSPAYPTRSHVSDSDSGRAEEAERQVNAQIAAAEEQLAIAKNQAEATLNRIEDDFQRTSASESERLNTELEAERTRGYQQIRDLQRNQQAELRRMRREGDTEQARTIEHYRNLLRNSTHNYERQLGDTLNEQVHRLEYEQSKGESQTEQLRASQEAKLKGMRDLMDAQTEQLSTTNKRETDRIRGDFEAGQKRSNELFEERFKKTIQDQNEIIDRLYKNSGEKLAKLREEMAEQLSIYETRQQDSFYRILRLNSELVDEGDAYCLTIQIPKYEQSHISASVKGDNLVISGYRRNQEDMTLEEGHTAGSASFQSFHESFPLAWPVEAGKLTRQYHGNEVMIRVPKKGPFAHRNTPHKIANEPERTRANKPEFPDSIRLNPNPRSEQPIPTRRGSGSDTLT